MYRYANGVADFYCNKVSDIATLPRKNEIGDCGYVLPDGVGFGSSCICIEDGRVYFLRKSNSWLPLGESDLKGGEK